VFLSTLNLKYGYSFRNVPAAIFFITDMKIKKRARKDVITESRVTLEFYCIHGNYMPFTSQSITPRFDRL